jgi:hypothetical protein
MKNAMRRLWRQDRKRKQDVGLVPAALAIGRAPEDRADRTLAVLVKVLLAIAGAAAGLTVGYLVAIAAGLANLNG